MRPDVAATAAVEEPELQAALTLAEDGELLVVSRWLVRRLVASGALPAARRGCRTVICRARLLAWLDNQR